MYPSKSFFSFAPVALFLTSHHALAEQFETSVYNFLSRPDIRVPRLIVDAYEPEQVAPGNILLTPWAPEAVMGVNYKFGPVMYDNDGELVWTGYHEDSPKRDSSMGFEVIEYDGKPHLAYPQKESHIVYGHVVDEHYQPIRNVSFRNTEKNPLSEMSLDMHEFKVVTPATLAASGAKGRKGWVQAEDPPTAIVLGNSMRKINRTHVCNKPIDWVRDDAFQELSMDGLNNVIFEWNPVDHLPVVETSMCPGDMDNPLLVHNEQGSSKSRAFDFTHRNAVDKLPDGNFIASLRHMSTVYKINHKTGEIMWRVGGGHKTDFKQTSIVPGVPLNFSFQHDLRVANNLPGTDPANGIYGITLWDNANARYSYEGATSDRSRGKSILINENTMEATLISAFSLPDHGLGTNQGAHQALLNGNHLIGGGNLAEVIEYTTDTDDLLPFEKRSQEVVGKELQREPVFAAHFGGGPMNSYRARRFEWQAWPTTSPDVFAYRQSCSTDNRTYVYASWNGATEVASWKVYAAPYGNTPDSDFRMLLEVPKHGFETIIPIDHAGPDDEDFHVYAIASDSQGKPLGRSAVSRVWIPNAADLQSHIRDADTYNRRKEARRHGLGQCGEKQCVDRFHYEHDRARDCPVTAPKPDGPEPTEAAAPNDGYSNYVPPPPEPSAVPTSAVLTNSTQSGTPRMVRRSAGVRHY